MTLSDFSYLFTITDRFSVQGRGVVIVPGIPWEGVPTVKRGDPLMQRTPLGEVIETSVRDLELIRYAPGGKHLKALPLLLPSEIHKFDIPIGTEVSLGVSNQAMREEPLEAP